MPEDIQEIPLDIAEEMQDIVKDIPELLPEPPVAPAVQPPEEVKPVIKPKKLGPTDGSGSKYGLKTHMFFQESGIDRNMNGVCVCICTEKRAAGQLI